MSLDPKIMIEEDDEPPNIEGQNGGKKNILYFIKNLIPFRQDPTLRETIEEYIEEDLENTEETSISSHEKSLISNVLSLTNMSVSDIMIPRANIIAINTDITQKELFNLLSTRQYSRLPVYIDTLDNIIGSIHVKDILATIARGEVFNIKGLIRELPIISPSMQTLDLLLQMRETKKHMAMIIDEYGGTDGLITLEDIIESIVGEIDDEHDPDNHPEITTKTNGDIIADARVNLDDFEKQFGKILSNEERNENETLGGLVFFIAGRVPARGEVLSHKSGIKFEVIEADPRRIKTIQIHNSKIKDK